MLDYKLIEAFSAVVETGSFEKAACFLNLTQSAISQRVKLLEEQTGQILLIRSSPPKPSIPGIDFLAHYKKVVLLEKDLFSIQTNLNTDSFRKISLAMNADTIGTWFPQIILPYLQQNDIVLDLKAEDQDQTHNLLKNGEVMACVASHDKAIQGCKCEHLGAMTYGFYCTKTFYEKWFKYGFTSKTASASPALYFNIKDKLNVLLHRRIFGKDITNVNSFYIPSTELFAELICENIGYGALPAQQSNPLLAQGKIIKIAEGKTIEVNLFYHSWNLKSSLLDDFSIYFIKKTKSLLGD